MIVKTFLIAIVSFLLVIPAAFSQSEEEDSSEDTSAVTYSFRVENATNGPLAYRCDGDALWITIPPGSTDWGLDCDTSNLELHDSPSTSLVAHDCSEGTATREVTVTSSAFNGNLDYSSQCL